MARIQIKRQGSGGHRWENCEEKTIQEIQDKGYKITQFIAIKDGYMEEFRVFL